MARRHQALGLHTREERTRALVLAQEVYQQARQRIISDEDREALLFAQGYLTAVGELAHAEGAAELAVQVDALHQELLKTFYGTP